MKRFVRWAFLLVGLSCWSGWLGELPAAERRLRVATFQSEVTLPVGHWLYRRPLETVETPLLAKGIVLECDGQRYVLCAVDWCTLRNSAHRMFQARLADAVGTDPSRVAVHCVHQHTAPSVDADAQKLLQDTEKPLQRIDLAFLDEVTKRLAEAAKQAVDKLEPFNQVGLGTARVDRVASIRRLRAEDGSALTRWSSCKDPKLRAMPEGNIDPILKTITLARDRRPLVRLHYYATHPQSFYGDGRACWDVPGFARQRLEAKEGVFQIYFTGCAGDVTMGKYNDGSPEARRQLSQRLYAALAAASAATRWFPADSIQWRVVRVRLPVRNEPDWQLDRNRALLADPEQSETVRTRAAGRVACALRMKEPIELSLLAIGPVHILHLPGEPMIEFQHFAQTVLAERVVAVAGYGLGDPGYLCTAQAYEEGGYEPSASMCPPEAEEILKRAIRKLLKGG